MKKVGLIVLVSGIVIAVLSVGLHRLMAQQGQESVTQDVAQDIAQGRPEGGPPEGGPPGGGPSGNRPEGAIDLGEDLGEPIASTEADTSGVLCDASTNVLNEQLGFAK